MAKLSHKQRNSLPTSAFAIPETRSFPIPDENHARAALSMLHNAPPAQQARIKAAIARRFPNVK